MNKENQEIDKKDVIIAKVRKGTATKYVTVPLNSNIEVDDYVVIKHLEPKDI